MAAVVNSILERTENNRLGVKIKGRANFQVSKCFKDLVAARSAAGCRSVVLDLSDCLIMDSTFLGMLTGLEESKLEIELLNANDRVRDLLDNLDLTRLFRLTQGEPLPGAFRPADPCAPTKEELSVHSLEAHKKLIETNPENEPKFRGVVEALEEEMKRGKPPGTT